MKWSVYITAGTMESGNHFLAVYFEIISFSLPGSAMGSNI
jgi:hypothetical protein